MTKKLFYLLLTALMFSSCGLYNSSGLNSLQLGMSKEEVDRSFGRPDRLLSVSDIGGIYQEVYEYRISKSGYALEFHNNRLARFDLMYEDDYPPVQPGYPGYPIYPGRPVIEAPSPGRPPTGGGGGGGRPPVQPEPSRPGPSRPQPSRPGTSGKPETTNPEPSRPGPSRPTQSTPAGSRESTKQEPATRPASNTDRGSSSTRTNDTKTDDTTPESRPAKSR